MSAFMVADDTINRVVSWLYWEVIKSQSIRDKLEQVSGIDTTSYAWPEALGKAMFELNSASVNDRYGDGEAEHFRKLAYQYEPAHGSPIQVLKSLQCWLYQFTEGEVVKQPLYQFFQDTVEPHYCRLTRIPGGCLGVRLFPRSGSQPLLAGGESSFVNLKAEEMNQMKYFLATYEILDGEHEYSGAVIFEVETADRAYKLAEAEEYDPETDTTTFYFSFAGDGTTACRNTGCREISPAHMEFLERVGLASRK
jgi:hypothetical protein